MKQVSPILTGQYLKSQTRQAPPKELAQAMGMPVTEALQEVKKEEVDRG